MKKIYIRWQLVAYDVLVLGFVEALLLLLYKSNEVLSVLSILIQSLATLGCVFSIRVLGGVYRQIWRYGGIQCYIRLLITDGIAFILNVVVESLMPVDHITFGRLLAIVCMNLLGCLAIRMIYRYAYKCGNSKTTFGRFLMLLLRIFAGEKIQKEISAGRPKINVAIIGAGRVGVSLAEELLSNESAHYIPRCFVDINKDKADRAIHGIPVLLENDMTLTRMKELEIQEVVFALPNLTDEDKKRQYHYYASAGYKIKVYDFPIMQAAGGKRSLREFDVEELLFRKPTEMRDEKTVAYYQDKTILITGGGGSIGSELCRQLAKMQPKQIIILDICENGAYDVQQELKIVYRSDLDLRLEIASITNRHAMERVFRNYRPQIVINAAAHKHVPLMEHNCIEAVENNVFGTEILVDLCEKYQAERFMMVSTDKAVNPTNVMGATKRMCEMIVQSASINGKVKYSTTRFGNVLGSAGSVIPLFKKQIAGGGPITITDKRIIRYFMTIPEASQLVLQSGAMAQNGELFVLDMGQPVKIYDLAENLIRLSGVKDIEILEIGLRPGEKLYEELLVNTDKLEKTENSLIFIEREKPLDRTSVEEKLAVLREACVSGDDEQVRAVLHQVVPTYKDPDEVNASAEDSAEMKNTNELVHV